MSNVKFQIVQSKNEGYELAKKLLYKNCDRDTVLFLSGGSTPKPLYEILANEQKLKVGALAMVDDRYGPPMHANSNERMIANTGLFKYARTANIPIYLQLKSGLSLEKTTETYEKIAQNLFKNFPKRIAILGIGADGHIASLPAQVKSQKFKVKSLEFVSYLRTFPVEPKIPRISLNLNALQLMNLLIVLAFGEEKKEGIKIALKTFFKTNLAKKTILITDQKV